MSRARLQRAAQRFDTLPCYDAYSGDLLFKAQLALYDDARRDSESTQRRVLSVAPGTVMPPRRTVKCLDVPFIIGAANPDGYLGSTLRVGYVAHEADGISQVLTLGQACRNEAGFTAYTSRVWVANEAEVAESSLISPREHVHFAAGEPVQDGMIVVSGMDWLLIRERHVGPAGTLVGMAEMLPSPVRVTAQMYADTYNPVTEQRGAVAQAVTVLRLRWQLLFRYAHLASPKFGADDVQLVMNKASATPKVGYRVTMTDGEWLITGLEDAGDVWLCRGVRRA